MVLEDGVEPALEEGRAGAGAGVEVTAAGVVDVDAVAAAAAMVPLRSHGFGGEAIVQIEGSRVHRNHQTESGFSDKMYVRRREQPTNIYFDSQTSWQTDGRGAEEINLRKNVPPEGFLGDISEGFNEGTGNREERESGRGRCGRGKRKEKAERGRIRQSSHCHFIRVPLFHLYVQPDHCLRRTTKADFTTVIMDSDECV